MVTRLRLCLTSDLLFEMVFVLSLRSRWFVVGFYHGGVELLDKSPLLLYGGKESFRCQNTR